MTSPAVLTSGSDYELRSHIFLSLYSAPLSYGGLGLDRGGGARHIRQVAGAGW